MSLWRGTHRLHPFDQGQWRSSCTLPLMHCANQLSLGWIGPHFHQAAAKAARVGPQGPLKVEYLLGLAVKALQGTGARRATALEAHTGALWGSSERERERENSYRKTESILESCREMMRSVMYLTSSVTVFQEKNSLSSSDSSDKFKSRVAEWKLL